MERAEDVATLVTGARQGDSGCWDALVERYLPLVCASIARCGLRHAEADDVNQTVWLRLVEHLGDLHEPAALPGWIVTTTRRECLRAVGKSRRLVPVDPQSGGALGREDETADEGDLDSDLLAAERRQALREGLAELPDDRRALLLVLLEEPPPSYAEVSTRLGIPVGSIGPTRARALAQLRDSDALRRFLDSTDRGR